MSTYARAMAKVRKPLYDWNVLIVSLVVLAVIILAVWLLMSSFKNTVYIEEQHEAPLKPTDTPYDSGVIAY